MRHPLFFLPVLRQWIFEGCQHLQLRVQLRFLPDSLFSLIGTILFDVLYIVFCRRKKSISCTSFTINDEELFGKEDFMMLLTVPPFICYTENR